MGDNETQCWDGIEKCYRKHGRVLLKVIGSHVDNAHHAEELLQDLFLKLYENKISIDPDHPTTRNYLLVAARNHAFDYLKKQRWEAKNVVNMNMDAVEIDAAVLRSLEDAVISGDIISTLHDTLNALPDREKDIFIRKTFLGHTVRAISGTTGLSLFKVNCALKKATRALRSELRDYYMG